MSTNSSRENILQRIAAAQSGRLSFVTTPTQRSGEIYKQISPDAISCFKAELEAISGICILCETETDLYSKLKKYVSEKKISYVFSRDSYIYSQLNKFEIPVSTDESDFEQMQVGITGCEFLVARTGSLLISAANQSGRQLNVFPPIHIVIAHTSQLVDYPEDAFVAMQEKYGNVLPSLISTITGPSRTADIEKTLVLGAHGPKELVVFLSKE